LDGTDKRYYGFYDLGCFPLPILTRGNDMRRTLFVDVIDQGISDMHTPTGMATQVLQALETRGPLSLKTIRQEVLKWRITKEVYAVRRGLLDQGKIQVAFYNHPEKELWALRSHRLY
jgi:hypothetical protein